MGKGKFLVLEGISGSGKTTLLKKLVSFLIKNHILMISNAEPTTHHAIGKTIRSL